MAYYITITFNALATPVMPKGLIQLLTYVLLILNSTEGWEESKVGGRKPQDGYAIHWQRELSVFIVADY